MSNQIVRHESVTRDGRSLILYRAVPEMTTRRRPVTVVTGSTALAEHICSALLGQGIEFVRISEGELAPDGVPCSRLYQGAVGMSEIWESIFSQYVVDTVIHTAILDFTELDDPVRIFASVVGETVAMVQHLRHHRQPIRLISATLRRHTLGMAGQIYEENLGQFEEQMNLMTNNSQIHVVLFRLGKMLMDKGGKVTTLWGGTPGLDGARDDVLMVDDVCRAFVKAYQLETIPDRYWVAELASRRSNDGIHAREIDTIPWNAVGLTQRILDWHPDVDRLERAISAIAGFMGGQA